MKSFAMPFARLLTPLAAALLLAYSPFGVAQTLDLARAHDLARQQDSRLLAARAQARANAERVPQAQAQLRPTISLSAAENRNLLDTTAANALGIPTTNTQRYTSSSQTLSLRQALVRPQYVTALEQAEALVRDGEFMLANEEQNAAVRIASAYMDALLAKDQLALIEQQKTSTRTQLDAARRALVAGSGTRTDVDLSQARLDMALAQEIEARQTYEQSLRQIQVLVGQKVDSVAPLDTRSFDPTRHGSDTIDDWIDRALRNNGEIQSLSARAEAARLELDKASRGHYPTLDLVLQVSRTRSDSVTSVGTTYYNRVAGLQLNVPIYSGGYLSSIERQALAQYENAQALLENGQRDLTLRVQREYRGVTEGAAKIRALEQAVRSSTTSLDSTRKSFSAGARTLLNVLEAEQDLLVSQRNLSQARYNYAAAWVRLGALAGEGPQRVQEVNAWLLR